jgi:hypothetical protein
MEYMQIHLDRSQCGRPDDGGGPTELRPCYMYNCDVYVSERQRGVDTTSGHLGKFAWTP